MVFSKCAQCHHPDGSAPFSLLTYREARSHATQIAPRRRRTASCRRGRRIHRWTQVHRFGSADAIGDRHSSRWVADGAREGNRRDLPAAAGNGPEAGSSANRISSSHCQHRSCSRPTARTSRACSCCRCRSIAGGTCAASSSAPTTRAIHHANIRVDATPASRELDEQDPAPGYDGIIVRSAVYPDGHFLGWTPGQAAPLLPKGLAWNLAPNSDLVIQLHLVPSGKA